MTKGKLVAILICFALALTLLSVGVRADFSYRERYDNHGGEYDKWIYDIDIDDEDTRVTVKHYWSSPRYEYEYETESEFPFHTSSPTPRYRPEHRRGFNGAPRNSYQIGRDIVDLFSGRSRNSYSRSYERNWW